MVADRVGRAFGEGQGGSAIGTPSTATCSHGGGTAWGFVRSSSPHERPGRIPSPSASSGRFDENASITSSSSTNGISDACWAGTSPTTTRRARIRLSTAIAPIHEKCSRQSPGESSRPRRWGDFITVISASPDPSRFTRRLRRRPRGCWRYCPYSRCPSVLFQQSSPEAAEAGQRGSRIGTPVVRQFLRLADAVFDQDRWEKLFLQVTLLELAGRSPSSSYTRRTDFSAQTQMSQTSATCPGQ